MRLVPGMLPALGDTHLVACRGRGGAWMWLGLSKRFAVAVSRFRCPPAAARLGGQGLFPTCLPPRHEPTPPPLSAPPRHRPSPSHSLPAPATARRPRAAAHPSPRRCRGHHLPVSRCHPVGQRAAEQRVVQCSGVVEGTVQGGVCIVTYLLRPQQRACRASASPASRPAMSRPCLLPLLAAGGRR